MGIPLQPINLAPFARNPMLNITQIASGLSGLQTQASQRKLAAAKEKALANQRNLPTGIAGQYAQLEQYKEQFGEDSPQYQQLSNALGSQQHLAAQRGNYYSALASTIGQRYSPMQQRQQVISQLTNMGYPVSTINTLNDQQRAAIVQQNVPYAAYLAKTGGAQLTQGATQAVPTRGIGGGVQAGLGGGMQQSQPPLPTGLPGGIPPSLGQPSPQQMPQAMGAQAMPPVPDKRLAQLAHEQGQQAQSAIFKTASTTDQANRLNASSRVLPPLQMMASNAPLALQYSGIVGKSKKMAAKLRQDNDPRYLAYKKYKQDQAVAEQDAAMALGIKATDKAFESYAPMFKIDSWDVTPQQAGALFNNLGQIVHREGQKNALNLEQQRQSVLGSKPIQISEGTSTPITIPKFSNAAAGQEWFKNLSPQQQDEVSKKLGDGG